MTSSGIYGILLTIKPTLTIKEFAMNILLSLLVYNPLEAYTMILLCDLITGNNTHLIIKNVWKLFLFSSLNVIVQLVPYLWYGEWAYSILNIIVAYTVIPLLLKHFYVSLFYGSINNIQPFIVMFIISVFAIVIPVILNFLFDINTIFYNYNGLHEFIVNFVIFFLQIPLYKIMLIKRDKYEKYYQGICRKYD